MRRWSFARLVGAVAACGLAIGASRVAADERLGKKDVPAPVLQAFQKAYPGATVKGYGKEVEKGKTCFEIESVEGGKTRDLLYLPDGTVVEIEEGVAESELPAAVKGAIASKHPGGRIEKAERNTRGAAVQYDVRIAAGKGRIEMSVDPAGKVLSEKHLGAATKPAEKD